MRTNDFAKETCHCGINLFTTFVTSDIYFFVSIFICRRTGIFLQSDGLPEYLSCSLFTWGVTSGNMSDKSLLWNRCFWILIKINDTVNSRLADTLLLQTLAITDKIQIPGRRGLTGNDYRFYGLSLLWTLNNVPKVSATTRVNCS